MQEMLHDDSIAVGRLEHRSVQAGRDRSGLHGLQGHDGSQQQACDPNCPEEVDSHACC